MTFTQKIRFHETDAADYRADAAFRDSVERVKLALDDLRERIAANALSCLQHVANHADTDGLARDVEKIRRFRTDFVVLGVGGSSLGAQTFCALKNHEFGNFGGGTFLHFPDNLSAHSMDQLVDSLDLGTAHFLIVSKSGATAETLAQAALCLQAAESTLVGTELKNHFSVIVGPGPSPLRAIAERYEFPVYDHDEDLSGRFSAFSLVGMFPALVAGLDVRALRQGGQQIIDRFVDANEPLEIPSVAATVMADFLRRKHKVNMSVMMPYDQRLANFARWYQQLWSESLGKGDDCTTPLCALGPSDQHSQLQLFLSGPRDKFITIVHADSRGRGPNIGAALAADMGFDYLGGRTVGDLVSAETRAATETLVRHGRPVREIEMTAMDEESLGALMTSFMLETILMAGVLGVNPFDQPAVEEGKRLTVDYLKQYAGQDPEQP